MSRFSIYISANSQIYEISYLWTTPLSPLSPPASEVGGVRKAKLSNLHLQQDGTHSFKLSLFTCALWLLMPARQEKIIGESDWGAALPTMDSHLSGDIENTSATWPRGMFTAPGIAPSDANSLGWRTYLLWCKRLAWNLSHVHDQDIFWSKGSA